MDCDIMQAVRDLAEFANDHAREVFGEKEELEYGTVNGDAILESARVALAYLDGDEGTCTYCDQPATKERDGHEPVCDAH